MSTEQFDLFLILLKLKSYLISLIDNPDFNSESLKLTEEFLDRKYPELTSQVLEMFEEYDIHDDSEIAFNEKIHLKFKEMVKSKAGSLKLDFILEKYNIQQLRKISANKRLMN